jgi:hypothetical protein
VEEYEREHIVAELEAFWSRDPESPQPEIPQEDPQPDPRKKKAKDD